MAASGTSGTGITWVLDDDNVLTISGSGAVSSSNWSNYKDLVYSVIVEEGITSLPDECFHDTPSIVSVQLSSTLTSIGAYAFYGCTGIQKLYVPSLESWFAVAFGNVFSNPMYYRNYPKPAGCDLYVNGVLATQVDLPAGATQIPMGRFAGCKSIVTVNVPEGVTTIKSDVFHACDTLIAVNLPSTLTTIESYNFYRCANIRTVTIPDKVTSLGSSSMSDCPELREVTLGRNIKTLSVGWFSELPSLAKLSVGINFKPTNFGAYLNQCRALTEVVIPDANPNYSVVDGVVYSKDLTTAWYVPLTKLDAGLLSSVTVLGHSLYRGRTELTTYTFLDSIVTISQHCFEDCTNLKRLRLPLHLATIKVAAFKNCASITTVNLPKSVSRIEGASFNGCTTLVEFIVNVPVPPTFASSYILEGGTFANCPALVAIKVPVGSGETYKAMTGWSTYADLIVESKDAGSDVGPADPEHIVLDPTVKFMGWLLGRQVAEAFLDEIT